MLCYTIVYSNVKEVQNAKITTSREQVLYNCAKGYGREEKMEERSKIILCF